MTPNPSCSVCKVLAQNGLIQTAFSAFDVEVWMASATSYVDFGMSCRKWEVAEVDGGSLCRRR